MRSEAPLREEYQSASLGKIAFRTKSGPHKKRRDPERSRLLWFIESDYRDYVLALVVGHRLTSGPFVPPKRFSCHPFPDPVGRPCGRPAPCSEAIHHPGVKFRPDRLESLRIPLGPVFRIAPRSRSRAPRSGVLAPHLMDIACFFPSPPPCLLRHGSHRLAPGPASSGCDVLGRRAVRVCSLMHFVGLPKRSQKKSPESSPCK